MGINNYHLYLFDYFSKKKPFKKTITIGRQKLMASRHMQYKYTMPNIDSIEYTEEVLINNFKAESCVSLDISDYENPTYKIDITKENNIPNESFDTVIDTGSLEHMANPYNALNNYKKMCKDNGQIILSLPNNNQSGHGFYQISSDLLFAFFSKKNGFAENECYLCDWSESARLIPRSVYEVKYKDIEKGLNIYSKVPVCIFFKTVKTTSLNNEKIIQPVYEIIIKNKYSKNITVKDKNLIQKMKQYKLIIYIYTFLKFLGLKISETNNNYFKGRIFFDNSNKLKKKLITNLIK